LIYAVDKIVFQREKVQQEKRKGKFVETTERDAFRLPLEVQKHQMKI